MPFYQYNEIAQSLWIRIVKNENFVLTKSQETINSTSRIHSLQKLNHKRCILQMN